MAFAFRLERVLSVRRIEEEQATQASAAAQAARVGLTAPRVLRAVDTPESLARLVSAEPVDRLAHAMGQSYADIDKTPGPKGDD